MTEAERYAMLLVKILYRDMNLSFSLIAQIAKELGQSRNKVKAIYDKVLEQIDEENGSDLPKSRKSIDLRYVGSTSDVEYIDGAVHHNVCGGGRKSNEINADS